MWLWGDEGVKMVCGCDYEVMRKEKKRKNKKKLFKLKAFDITLSTYIS